VRALALALAGCVLASAGCQGTGAQLQRTAPGYTLDDAAVAASPHAGVRWKAFLVAGDSSIRAFDNAVKDLAVLLERRGITVARRFSSEPAEVSASTPLATVANLQRAAAAARVAPGEGCLVYATSHGSVQGLYLSADPASGKTLTPPALKGVLDAACGDGPRVVVMSGCHTGTFLRAETVGPSTILLTAAETRRKSFGCRAERRYTYYDGCMLRELPRAATWQRLHAQVRACIEAQEKSQNELPSLPQAFFGRQMKDLPIPKETRS
jgi:hypothetical protein